MAERVLFEAFIPDGQRLDYSRSDPTARRATLRDDNNHLVGSLELHPVEEDYEDYSDYEDCDEEDDGGSALGWLALAGVVVGGSWLYNKYQERRDSSRQLEESEAPDEVHNELPEPGWCLQNDGTERWWDGTEWSEHVRRGPKRSESVRQPTNASLEADPRQLAQASVRPQMTSQEWQERFKVALLARVYSARELGVLRDAVIVDASPRMLEFQNQVRSADDRQLADEGRHLLEQYPRVFEEMWKHNPAGWYRGPTGLPSLWDGRTWAAVQEPVPVHAVRRQPPGWYLNEKGAIAWWTGESWAERPPRRRLWSRKR